MLCHHTRVTERPSPGGLAVLEAQLCPGAGRFWPAGTQSCFVFRSIWTVNKLESKSLFSYSCSDAEQANLEDIKCSSRQPGGNARLWKQLLLTLLCAGEVMLTPCKAKGRTAPRTATAATSKGTVQPLSASRALGWGGSRHSQGEQLLKLKC